MQQDASRGAECSTSAGLIDCIQKRGRLLQLHKGLEEFPPERGKSGSFEVLSKEEEQRRNEEDEEDRLTEEGPRSEKAKCKTRK
ncbi:hypothetical protein MHYP_G00353090 [Metynnis hypsauchen]